MIISLAQQDECECKRIISIETKYFIPELAPFGAVSEGEINAKKCIIINTYGANQLTLRLAAPA